MGSMSADMAAELAARVEAVDEVWRARTRAHLDALTKPLGSLGRLEDLAAQVAAVRGDKMALPLRKAVYVFAADHGVTAEGVSAYPSSVTRQMVHNFLRGGAAINVLARRHEVKLHVVDVGVDADFGDAPGLLDRKIARGTANMLREAAMTEEQVARALQTGAESAEEAASAGVTLLAVGEMGIGNTTAASAITCALTGARPEDATGRGTGLDDASHRRKVAVVAGVLERFATEVPGAAPIDILRSTGGLEIAAMTGMVLAAAHHRIILVADGFISTAAVAIAMALQPKVCGYLVAGHRSEEPGHRILLSHLKLEPVLALGMRLGEGTGAVLAMPVIEAAVALYLEMATFASAGVSEASR